MLVETLIRIKKSKAKEREKKKKREKRDRRESLENHIFLYFHFLILLMEIENIWFISLQQWSWLFYLRTRSILKLKGSKHPWILSCLCACMLSHFSLVWPFATLWTVAGQAPPSMGFSRQEDWNGLPCPPPQDLPDPGIKPVPLRSSALADGFFTTSATWEVLFHVYLVSNIAAWNASLCWMNE